MATAHFHMSDGKAIIQEFDSGVAALSAEIRHSYDEGRMITVDGFEDGGIDSVLLNPDHVVKVYLIAD